MPNRGYERNPGDGRFAKLPHSPSLFPSALIAVAGTLVLLGTLCFSSLRHGNSQAANTISELGETGSPHAGSVGFVLFLPVGLLVWLAFWLLRRATSGKDFSLVLLPLFSLGTGYVVSALFPCDPGAPLWGSWRTLVHNVAGLFDYGGTAIGFLIVWRRLAKGKATAQAAAFGAGGMLVLVSLVMLCLPSAFPIRGAVQRVAELIHTRYGKGCVKDARTWGSASQRGQSNRPRNFLSLTPQFGPN